MSDALTPVLQRIDADFEHSLGRLKELLRIPSIGTDRRYDAETRRAAVWCAEHLAGMGFDAAVRETNGHPVVLGRCTGPASDAEGVPTILYYGHYDVQPPDPLELWDSEPFDPQIVEGAHGKRLVARGAVDDKGQLMMFVEAFRAWTMEHGTLPVKVVVMLEGEEESGSPSLDAFLEQHRDELAADVCVVSDTAMWDIDTPAVTCMLRGMIYINATLKGPSHDLHSGLYGGAARNPNTELARIIAQLHDERGVVQLPGFYDAVVEVPDEQRRQWERLGFDEAALLAAAGLTVPGGEQGRGSLERLWARPTCEINGMWGGYTGEGAKTVIPAEASVKISCRLVAEQDPHTIHALLVKFLEDRTPPDFSWEIATHAMASPIRVSTDSPYLEAAIRALRVPYENEPVLIGSGGSIPVVGSIQRILGFDSLLMGFGLDDDRAHSPNEKFELRNYLNGMKAHAALLDELSRLG
jgi:acetylornithine deacetylase/succinyl-diaminopimelate desuccinylase-like protein